VWESPRFWLTPESLYCPLLCGDFIVETELDLGDHLEWIRVERDPALCELHNRDVGILCGWPNFRKILCPCASHFDLLPILGQVCSCLEFDLTLGLIPRV
jgi:hypothetical protein